MLSDAHHFVRPADASERAYLEALIREDFDRCHPGETLDDVKRRAAFTKEDRRLYQDWMALAATRADEAQAALRSGAVRDAGSRLPESRLPMAA